MAISTGNFVAQRSDSENVSTGDAFTRRRALRIGLVVVLSIALAFTALVSIVSGQYQVPLADLPGILAGGPNGVEDTTDSVVWRIRIPRLVLGLLVGAALGVSGALMQAVFANPLAEPSVIGVTSGAGVGAAVVIVFNIGVFGTTTAPIFAFLSAVLTTVLVYQISRFNGRVHVVNLILTGIAVNAVCTAIISFMIYIAPATAREQIVFWQMGSLNGSQWKHVSVVLIITVIGIAIAARLGSQLDLLALGEKAAGHIGLNVPRLRIIAIGVSTLLTAAAVSYAGLIGFVGLVVPHIVRTITGPSNKILIPASALGGAVLIGFADVIARTAVPYADLPIGIFTALVGGPTFFILLRRMMRKGRH